MTARTLVALALAAFASASLAAPDKPECIAGAKPGGGFDLTCKLAQQGMQEAKMLSSPMRITYMPGGVGAVAMNAVVGQRPTDGNAIVAFSGGSLLNIAQGKFGKWTENDVRWVAAIGTDYGCISVRADSPYKTLKDLMNAIKADPTKIAIGGGGTRRQPGLDQDRDAGEADRRRPEGAALRLVRGQRRGDHRAPGRPHPGGQRRRLRRPAAAQGRQDPHPGGLLATSGCRATPRTSRPRRSRATTSPGRSSAASTSLRRSRKPTTSSGSTRSTSCWRPRTSWRCATSATSTRSA